MQRVWLGLVLVVVAIVAILSVQLLSQQQQLQSAYRLSPPRTLSAFRLTDANNQVVDNAQLQQHWTLVFVGYTSCPDICPMTMAMLSGSYKDLQATLGEQPLQIWFVSVDPQRDTPTQLRVYMEYFANPAMRALTATHDQLFPFVRELDLMYAIATDTTDDYRVDHSASIALVDPQGRLVASFKPETAKEGLPPLVDRTKLLADFQAIVSTAVAKPH